MSNRSDGRIPGGSGSDSVQENVTKAVSTPQTGSGTDDAVGMDSSMQDTAMASRSQAMAAVTPDELPAMPSATAGPTAEQDSLIGQVLAGRYEVTAQIGRGGMGAVYEARHTLIGKRVAVKVLLDKYAEKDQVIARLEQEARLASSIGHENIIDITDFGATNDGRRFVVMEYLDGESLAQCISRDAPLPVERAVHICRQVASALGAAHNKGVVHRDVKPENVFLVRRSGRDFVKVVDFGISKSLRADDADGASPRLTQTGMVLGTPLYMSPEQARGDEDLDHRIDVYALGVIMYECMTGDVPFRGANYLNIISQVLSVEPPPPRTLNPNIPSELESITLKALAKEPAQRYQNMLEFDNDLAALEVGGTVGASSSSFWAMRRTSNRRSPARTALWIGGVAAVIVAVALSVGGLLSTDQQAAAPAVPPPISPDATPSAAAPSTDAAPPAPAVEEVHIRIESTPPGATVWADGGTRHLGTTPFDWPAIKENRTVELLVELDGFDQATIELNPYTDHHRTQSVRLKKAKRGQTTRKPPRRPPPNATTTTPNADKGDKSPDGTAGGELRGNPFKRKDLTGDE